ncbi:MAG: ribonuclease III [Spirochaetales bacterium]|nr:ribonuclease III [Spirochaetales bacterium]
MRLFRRTEAHLAPVVDGVRRDELLVFQRHAGIKFKDVDLLNLAFCHRSFANEQGGAVGNNERLEFFGDSVLGVIVAEYLYESLPGRAEGELAKIKSFVVSEASLLGIARELRVDNFILIGRGEEFSGGRSKRAILADAMEAVIGAYFLDSGLRETRRFVLRFLVPEIAKVLEDRHEKDYKTLLQEYAQRKFKNYPKYVVSKRTGPDHDRVFWIEVEVAGKSYGPGKGPNKKQAEQAAASLAYASLMRDSAAGRAHDQQPRSRRSRSRSGVRKQANRP